MLLGLQLFGGSQEQVVLGYGTDERSIVRIVNDGQALAVVLTERSSASASWCSGVTVWMSGRTRSEAVNKLASSVSCNSSFTSCKAMAPRSWPAPLTTNKWS